MRKREEEGERKRKREEEGGRVGRRGVMGRECACMCRSVETVYTCMYVWVWTGMAYICQWRKKRYEVVHLFTPGPTYTTTTVKLYLFVDIKQTTSWLFA